MRSHHSRSSQAVYLTFEAKVSVHLTKDGIYGIKTKPTPNSKKHEIILFTSQDGVVSVPATLEHDTIWLTQDQMAAIFEVKRPAVTKHLSNIFKTKELDENSVRSILEHTAADGKNYATQFYNLDAIIAVGYRVNSKRATQFRIWATAVLRDYILKGYAVLTEDDQECFS